MNFLENLQSQASSWLTNFGPQVIESGLQSTGLIKVAAPPTSNLTAAQVQSGATGSIQNFGGAERSATPAWLIPVVIGVAALGVILFAFKGKK